MKISKNNLFWILQTIGWGIPAFLNSWGKFVSGAQLNPIYIITEGLLFFIGGVISTTVFRFHLKKDIDFNKLHQTKIFRIIRNYIGAISVFFMVMVIALGANIIIHRPPHPVYHVTKMMLFSTVLNIAVYVFFWFVLYMSIKIFRHLRQAKIESLELQTELKEAQLNTLKGQINPHFMFNSLNNIRGLILEDKHKARDMLTSLSEMLRYSLNKDKNDTIALSEELEMVENFIALSKIQLEDRLHFSQFIDESLLKQKIPPMIIQMLIENAVKHGIAKNKKGGEIQLTIKSNYDNLKITVTNSGQLNTQSDSTKLGLKNIQKRLKLLYKDSASFNLQEKNHQVIATIELPQS